jgi:hypothetical protein
MRKATCRRLRTSVRPFNVVGSTFAAPPAEPCRRSPGKSETPAKSTGLPVFPIGNHTPFH